MWCEGIAHLAGVALERARDARLADATRADDEQPRVGRQVRLGERILVRDLGQAKPGSESKRRNMRCAKEARVARVRALGWPGAA